MRTNQNTLLEGKLAVLVPYNSSHVPRYHNWMKSEELQKLTASEPLTLEQEYEMQRSWREDADKCTFIVLDKQRWENSVFSEDDCMLGDVNLFLTNPEDLTVGEIEVMIAEPSCRGKGYGKEVTLMMMHYGVTRLGIKMFEAKIGLENKTSIFMFKKLHFEEVSASEVFREVTLQLIMDEHQRQWLLELMNYIEDKDYAKTRQQIKKVLS
ncbi:N-acetyltransferase 9 isoform X2 [Latimeria chalumnae]|uniref:Alpha/beta-tubulin-N-acetyltransferase 9 n=1 Tax=Latimeria chalumnae TaxID=7897 RepID=H3B1C3_LATCH|nr:PREDICTED: N-acetyltransferase 9 isoform X2 [Latimeria chalumnae]|eukprot:XP_005998328.1 PREDICTED: N-acetyltransferase 9 isoform X2 [Latimeria chalumnae]